MSGPAAAYTLLCELPGSTASSPPGSSAVASTPHRTGTIGSRPAGDEVDDDLAAVRVAQQHDRPVPSVGLAVLLMGAVAVALVVAEIIAPQTGDWSTAAAGRDRG